jgi:hypothetical protein
MIPTVLMNNPAGAEMPPLEDAKVVLEELRNLTVQEIADLPVFTLFRLQGTAEANLRHAKALADWLDGALAIRYGDRARRVRASHDKDTGTVRFEDNGFTVVADLPKRVKWDQRRLAELVELIRSTWGEDPANYVKTKFEVSERAYEAWPPMLREMFTPARSVETGKPSYDLLPPDGRRT